MHERGAKAKGGARLPADQEDIADLGPQDLAEAETPPEAVAVARPIGEALPAMALAVNGGRASQLWRQRQELLGQPPEFDPTR